MDLLFGNARDESDEDVVLELLNCSLFIYGSESRKWTRQAPGDLCRVLVFVHRTKCEVALVWLCVSPCVGPYGARGASAATTAARVWTSDHDGVESNV